MSSHNEKHNEDIPTDLAGLEPFLAVLDLPSDKIPTVEGTRKAFRAKLNLHPDKSGDTYEELFKSITQAIRVINLFLSDHGDHQTAAEDSSSKEDDRDLLSMLQKENRLSLNKTSVTFVIEKDHAETWISVLEKKLETVREPLNDKKGFILSNEKVKIPYAGIEVKITIRIWPNPKGSPKMVVEGKGYWPFVMCVLPLLIRKVKELKPGVKSLTNTQVNPQTPLPPPGPGATSLPQPQPTLPNHTHTSNVSSDTSAPPTIVATKVSDALAKMEAAIVDLGTSLNVRQEVIEKKVEMLIEATKGIPNKHDLSNLSKNLEILDESVKESVTKIKDSCKAVSDVSITLSGSDLAEFTDKVVENVVPALQTKLDANLANLNSRIDTLKITTDKIDLSVCKSVNEQEDMKNNLAGLPKLVTTLQGLLDNPNVKISLNNKTSPTSGESSKNQPSDQPKRRKCLVFTSSIAMDTPIEKLQADLNADIKIHKTYYIENNTNLTEPGAYLTQLVNQEMKSEIDFVIIQVGSNEMSLLDLKEDKNTIFEQIQKDCDKLVNLAKHMVTEYDVDVFISEKPPRYDIKSTEHGGILDGLNNTSNSILHMRTHLLERVFVVKQTMLESKSERVKGERFQQDGLHLTDKGLSLLNTNWVDCLKRVYTDLPQVQPQHSGHLPAGGLGQPRGRGGGGWDRRGGGYRNRRDESDSFNDYHRDGGGDNYSGGYRGQRNRGGYRGGGYQDQPYSGQYRGGYENRSRGGRGN